MKNQANFVSAVQFFLASSFLFNGLLHLVSALSYNGVENNFVADNWAIPLILLLTLIFGLGWWFEHLCEYLVLFKGRTTALLAFIGIVVAFGSIAFGSLVFTPRGFLRFAMSATGYTLISGFFFCFSVIRPEVTAKLKERN